MSMTPHSIHRRFGWRLPPLAGLLAFALILLPTPGLWGQSAAAPSSGQGGVQFEVLDVTTGSGSKTRGPANSAQQVNGVPAGQQSAQRPGQAVIPAVPAALPGVTPSPPRPLTPEQRELMDQHSSLISALEQWHRSVLGNYRIDVTRLADPFMPIKEVRGNPPGPGEGGGPDPTLPMIRQLDLSQLKLVAITLMTDRPGNAFASFEDGANNSYILRQGDWIGRNNGRIVKITPSIVTVEETGRRGSDPPRITEIKLNVLSSEGLTRAED